MASVRYERTCSAKNPLLTKQGYVQSSSVYSNLLCLQSLNDHWLIKEFISLISIKRWMISAAQTRFTYIQYSKSQFSPAYRHRHTVGLTWNIDVVMKRNGKTMFVFALSRKLPAKNYAVFSWFVGRKCELFMRKLFSRILRRLYDLCVSTLVMKAEKYLEGLVGGFELVDVIPEVPVPGVHPVHILLPVPERVH